MKTLSIIIPVFNEKNTILEVLKRIDAVSLSVQKEIIIVDDGSTDGTREICARFLPSMPSCFRNKIREKVRRLPPD